jgi:hypothetical protein
VKQTGKGKKREDIREEDEKREGKRIREKESRKK